MVMGNSDLPLNTERSSFVLLVSREMDKKYDTSFVLLVSMEMGKKR